MSESSKIAFGPDPDAWSYIAAESDVEQAWGHWRAVLMEVEGLRGADPEAIKTMMIIAWMRGAEVGRLIGEGGPH